MLLPDLIHRLDVKDPVVMVPFRGAILVASRHDARAIEAMLSTVENSVDDNNRWVSFRPAVLQGTTWAPFDIPAQLRERFRRLEVKSLGAGYGQQSELLEKIHAASKEDIFVASYQAVNKNDQIMTYSVWTEGVTHALLPVTDLVFFNSIDKGSEFHFVVLWSKVLEAVGELMAPSSDLPRRYKIRGFPSAEQLAALRASAET